MKMVPRSVQEIFSDKSLYSGVVELVGKLDGTMILPNDPSWADSRDYAYALGMAALARSDYVVLMHDLWDATWGEAGAVELGDESFNPCNPKEVWENQYQYRYFHLPNFHGEVWGCFYVEFYFHQNSEPGSGLMLSVGFYDTNDHQIDKASDFSELHGWQTQNYYDSNYDFLYSAIEKPTQPEQWESAISHLKTLATTLVKALRTDSNA